MLCDCKRIKSDIDMLGVELARVKEALWAQGIHAVLPNNPYTEKPADISMKLQLLYEHFDLEMKNIPQKVILQKKEVDSEPRKS